MEYFRLYEDGPSKPSINITMILGAIIRSPLHTRWNYGHPTDKDTRWR